MSPAIGFHDLGTFSPASITGVSEKQFRGHVSALIDQGAHFRPLTYWINNTRQVNDILLTFDDAFCRQLELARAVLTPLAIPAVAFVVADAVGASATWDYVGKRRRHATWTELREWVKEGFDIGSHACSHRDLCRLSDKALTRELESSKKQLEDELSVEVTAIAYPFGRSNRRVRTWAHAAGYRIGFGTRPSPAEGDAMSLSRLLVSRLDTPLSLAKRRSSGPWGAVERGKQRIVSFCSGGTPIWQELRGDYR